MLKGGQVGSIVTDQPNGNFMNFFPFTFDSKKCDLLNYSKVEPTGVYDNLICHNTWFIRLVCRFYSRAWMYLRRFYSKSSHSRFPRSVN